MTPYDEVTLLISKDLMNWIKLFLILLAVMPSTILGCWSIDKIARILVEKLTIGVYPALLIACLLFMDSIGIYIGRFTRLNSTDIFVRHNQAIQKFSLILKILTIDRSYFYFCSIFFFVRYHDRLSAYKTASLQKLGRKCEIKWMYS